MGQSLRSHRPEPCRTGEAPRLPVADKDGSGNEPVGSKNSPNVNFQFVHSMTKIIIVLKADGSFGGLGHNGATLKGLKSKARSAWLMVWRLLPVMPGCRPLLVDGELILLPNSLSWQSFLPKRLLRMSF